MIHRLSIALLFLSTVFGAEVIRPPVTLQQVTNIAENAVAAGGGAPVGTMVNHTASAIFKVPVYQDATGTNLIPKSIVAGSNITITTNSTGFTIAGTFAGTSGTVINSGSSAAFQVPVYSDTTGTNITPKSILAGSGVTVTTNSTGFTISATGSGGTVTGTGTASVHTRWASGGAGIEDGYLIDGSNFITPRTNLVTTLGSSSNLFLSMNTSNFYAAGTVGINMTASEKLSITSTGDAIGIYYDPTHKSIQKTSSAGNWVNTSTSGYFDFKNEVGHIFQILVNPSDGSLFFYRSGAGITFSTAFVRNLSGLLYNSNAGLIDGTVSGVQSFNWAVDSALGFRVAGAAAKGSILAGNGTNFMNTPAGTDGYTLYSDSSKTNGLRWDYPGVVDYTITAPGTTGNQTINKISGRVNIAAGNSTITVTNSLVSTTSRVFPSIATDDATAVIKNCVKSSGSFVITLTAPATAETAIEFIVFP